jgi:hypothetical protein
MHASTSWTPALDRRLLTLREAGVTWPAVAQAMGLGRNTVIERGRRLGARKLSPQLAVVTVEALDRPPRPAGHPDSWDLITAGTVLEGAAYPFPVFS